MPAVVGMVTLVALIGFYLVTGSTPVQQDASLIKAEAGVVVTHRPSLNYLAPAPAEVVQAVAPAVVTPVKTVVHATVQIQAPQPVAQPAPTPTPPPAPVPVAPQQDPAVTACLGVFAGRACTYTGAAGTVNGTCITPAFSPMTCISH